MADNIKNQMRPIARNLRPPPPPRFSQNDGADHKISSSSAFKANVLAYQAVRKVRISHFEHGPFMFCVQIETLEKDYQQLVGKLQKVELRGFKSYPMTIGMACLGRLEKKVYRVAIAKVPHHQNEDYYVNFVDFGFNRSIKFENLFHIPEDLITPLTFAMPFSLAGCKTKDMKVNEKEISFYFRLLTENQLLTLKCVPSDGPPIYQFCELYTADNVNILEKLKVWDPYNNLKFPAQGPLELKGTHDVKVSYAHSAQEFYIHLQKPEILSEYDSTFDELFNVMNKAPAYRNPKPGSCCAVNLGGDYYRGLVVGAKMNNTVQVKIVDFGIVEEIPEKDIHLLTEQFTVKPPQAFRACLKGFEGLEVSENISTQFEIFCGDGRGERKVFKMVIVGVTKDCYLVELEDLSTNPPVNVNKMLLKNSRPLIETIQMENAKKRQRDTRYENFDHGQPNANKNDRNGSQRGRGSYVSKGVQRQSPGNDSQQPITRSNISRSGKADDTLAGTYFTQKEASVWGSKESTPSDHNSIKSSDWDQPKNISREQNSSANWNDSFDSQRANKSKSPKAKTPPGKKTPTDLKCGWVSTLLSVNRAFVHYDDHVEGLQKILDEMFAFYEKKNLPPQLKEFQIGTDCAVRSNDGNWYRSRIESINGEKIKVSFREYGNSEVVQKSKIRVLDEKFAKIGDLGVKTYFPIKAAGDCDEKTLFNEMIKLFDNGSKEYNFRIGQKVIDGWILEPIDVNTGRHVFDDLVKAKKAQRIDVAELLDLLHSPKVEIQPKEVSKQEVKAPAPEIPRQKSLPKAEKPKDPAKKERKSPENVKKTAEKKPEQTKEEPVKAENCEIKDGRIAIVMTALTSPTDFYVSRVDDMRSFSKLHSDIQIIASGAAPLVEFAEGVLCLAQQPFDLCWYRAKIIDSDESDAMITVRCLDDGKTFSVDDKTFLKIMPAAVERKKFYGISCSLPIKIERKSEEEATDLMMKLMENDLHALFINEVSDDHKNFLELFNGSENVVDSLVEKKLAIRLEMIAPGKGYTSHINSMSSFYLQFEMDQLKLDLISQYFEQSKGNFEKVDPQPGDIVAALFADDDCWYRSKIESIESNGYLVSFIDYGNSCVVKNIGKIAESAIMDLPAMSKHCCLSKPRSVQNFSDEAEKKFIDICASGATILDVKSLPFKLGDAAEVELYADGKNIIGDLLQLCAHDVKLDQTIESIGSEILMSHNE